MTGYLQDDKGNRSSFRVLMVAFFVIVFCVLIVWGIIFVIESRNENPDYYGLAAILTALFGSGVGAFAAKAQQKRHERYD